MPGDSTVVLGEALTLAETEDMYAALGVERGTVWEQTLSAEEAAASFADAPESAARAAVYMTVCEGGTGLSLALGNGSGLEAAFAAALTAAGVADVTICAAAPESTDALALLPAVFKAYETLTCTTIAPEARETAAAALRETDALSQEIDTSRLEELLGDMDAFFEELSALSDEELNERIRSLAAERGLTLNDAQVQQLAGLFRKIQGVRFGGLAERVQDIPETVERVREAGESAADTAGSVWRSIRGFFRRVGETLDALFG